MRRRVFLGGVLLVLIAVGYYAIRTDADHGAPPSSVAHFAGRPRATTTHDDHAAIAGTVTDSANNLLVGVRVCAAYGANSSCSVTDPRGHYQILDLQAAEYIVRAGLPRHMPPHQQVVLLHVFEVRTVDLVMRVGGTEISGTVSDLGGGPIANASVTASPQTGDDTTVPVETDEHGEYHLWVSTKAAYIFASADGYVDATGLASPPGATDIQMIPEATVVGTVLDARTKQPVPNADVTLENRGHSIGSEKSDEDGRFEFRKLELGRYTAKARNAHGYGVADGSVAVAIGQHLDGVVVELHPAGSIVGKAVIIGTPEQPCVKAHVGMIREGEYSRADVAADGTFRIEGLSPGSYDPWVSARDMRRSARSPRSRSKPTTFRERGSSARARSFVATCAIRMALRWPAWRSTPVRIRMMVRTPRRWTHVRDPWPRGGLVLRKRELGARNVRSRRPSEGGGGGEGIGRTRPRSRCRRSDRWRCRRPRRTSARRREDDLELSRWLSGHGYR